MHEDRQLSTEAVNLISEYVDNFPRNENTNLEPDNAHDDDPNPKNAGPPPICTSPPPDK